MWWSSRWAGPIPSRLSDSTSKPFWTGRRSSSKVAAEVHAVYEACGFGFGLQRQLVALGIVCYVVCPQKLDEHNKRVKTDGLDAKALCLKLDRFVQGNRDALALVRVPSEEEEPPGPSIDSASNWLALAKRLEAQGRSLDGQSRSRAGEELVEDTQFCRAPVPEWMKELLGNSQPILLALEEKIALLTLQLQSAAAPDQPRGLGKLTSVIIDREIGDWHRFNNRRQMASYTGLCPGEHSSGNTRLQSCVTKHGNPRLRAALVELAWRLVRFQPNYKPVLKWRQILAKGALATGAARKKAIVALARQLAVDLWRVLHRTLDTKLSVLRI